MTTSSGVGGDPATTSVGSTVASSSSGGEMCGGAGPGTTGLDSEEQAFLQIINEYRAQNNLGPLAACTSLNRAAQGHSEDMRDQDYFSHTGLDNSSPWDRACDACYDLGCGPSTAMAENIAAGNSGAAATFDQWKNSPGHNANMLGASFTVIGIGRATGGGTYGVYWTNVFGGSSEPSCN
ncbi:MAG TPA: CAP domain-containing protein [Polyangiaceae bacterium]|nr:CAP domain-containing protein [Polyangiaceae bacterium]